MLVLVVGSPRLPQAASATLPAAVPQWPPQPTKVGYAANLNIEGDSESEATGGGPAALLST